MGFFQGPIFVFLMAWAAAVPAAAQSLVGKPTSIPSGTKIHTQDGKTYHIQTMGSVVLQKPVPGSRGGTYYPIKIGGKNYYLSSISLNRLGLNTSADCETLGSNPAVRNQSDLRILNTSLAEYPVSLRNIRSPNGTWSPSCSNYISDNGQLGPWGRTFLATAQGVKFADGASGFSAYDVLMQPSLWGIVCPGFRNFSTARKQHFVASFIATKSMDESGCNSSAINWNTPNPPGIGQFQLEGSRNLRASRSPAHCGGMYKAGTVQRSLPLGLEFSCAAYQIVTVQWNKQIPFCAGGGYWQEANRMGGDICQSMRAYPGCSR